MLLTTLRFRISTERIKCACPIAKVRTCHSLSSTNIITDRHRSYSDVLFCRYAISCLVVSGAIKAHTYLELCLSSGGGVMSEQLHSSSSVCP